MTPKTLQTRYGIIGFLVVAASCYGADWRQWGGPSRDFKVTSTGLADKWPDGGPKQIWKRELGPGYSSIAAADGKLYTMYRNGDDEILVALDAGTGKTLWEYKYAAPIGESYTKKYGLGPNASPLVLKDRLITIGFTAKMNCISLKGKLLWSHDLLADYGGEVLNFGYAASPTLYKGNVITLVGGKKNGVMAFKPSDGSVAWRSQPFEINYVTPSVINVDGQDQLVVFAKTEVLGLEADGGKQLWSFPCTNQYQTHATGAIWGDDNLLWVATQKDGGTRVLKLTQKGGKTNVEQVWENKKIRVFHWNSVRVGDHVYTSSGDTNTPSIAVNIKTGKIAWRERGFTKMLCLYADNKLIFLDENGLLAMAKVSPDGFEVLSKTQLTEKISWTVPTLVGKTLYVRDAKNILALDLG